MKKIVLFIVFCFGACTVNQGSNQNSKFGKIDTGLKRKLEYVLLRDQGIREIMGGNLSSERKAELLSKMKITAQDIEGNNKYALSREIDSINLVEVEKIIQKYGYPGRKLVGEPANKAVFYVIQHSRKIDEYLPLIRKATENGDIDKVSLAMMEDRNLMQKGIEQIYGTQIKGKANKKGEWIYFLWPVKNADSINFWRKNAGFEQTIEEYVKEMNVEFKFYTIKDLKDL
jgi:hypothetical protein